MLFHTFYFGFEFISMLRHHFLVKSIEYTNLDYNQHTEIEYTQKLQNSKDPYIVIWSIVKDERQIDDKANYIMSNQKLFEPFFHFHFYSSIGNLLLLATLPRLISIGSYADLHWFVNIFMLMIIKNFSNRAILL